MKHLGWCLMMQGPGHGVLPERGLEIDSLVSIL